MLTAGALLDRGTKAQSVRRKEAARGPRVQVRRARLEVVGPSS